GADGGEKLVPPGTGKRRERDRVRRYREAVRRGDSRGQARVDNPRGGVHGDRARTGRDLEDRDCPGDSKLTHFKSHGVPPDMGRWTAWRNGPPGCSADMRRRFTRPNSATSGTARTGTARSSRCSGSRSALTTS